ncbi:HipA N-terminal domain-containing protein [Alteromonas antoniana]|uniref:HipA N-terminal domain-containing protein n=1 Tax=Alteromonas antoniana TaxID=2803813 RepID=UPI001C44B8FE|nr:HipA N-terminal domain-containing protein [Alteromonas antoniana]
MNNADRAGKVLANGVLAGYLYEVRDGIRDLYTFVYDSEYLKSGSPIGHAFPLTDEPFLWDALPPFFENLVSEGWIRTHQTSRTRLDKQDSFGLLLANGEELIGALSVLPVEVS